MHVVCCQTHSGCIKRYINFTQFEYFVCFEDCLINHVASSNNYTIILKTFYGPVSIKKDAHGAGTQTVQNQKKELKEHVKQTNKQNK